MAAPFSTSALNPSSNSLSPDPFDRQLDVVSTTQQALYRSTRQQPARKAPRPLKPFRLRDQFLAREAQKQMDAIKAQNAREAQKVIDALANINTQSKPADGAKMERRKMMKPVGLWVDTGRGTGREMVSAPKKMVREEKEVRAKVNWVCGFCGGDCFCGGEDV